MKKIEFKKGQWEDFLSHAYNARFPFTPEMVQGDDFIANGENPAMRDGYDYTTLITKTRYKKGTKVTTTCEFQGVAAPLIVYTDKLVKDEAGKLWYSDCYEVVLWKNGINVWHLYKENGEIKPRKLLGMTFSVEENKKYVLSSTLTENGFLIEFGERAYALWANPIPNEVYIGITACEGVTKFYDLNIE